MKFKMLLMIAIATVGARAFAASYDCINDSSPWDAISISLGEEKSFVNGAIFGDKQRLVLGLAPEDYPVEVGFGRVLSTIVLDPDASSAYLDLPLMVASQPAPESLTARVIFEDDRQINRPFNIKGYTCDKLHRKQMK